ncbi:MAG: AsmA family protein [Candidatus Acidiferrales bacterium]
MKRWVKILLAVAALVVLVAAAIPLFVKADAFRPVIEKQLRATLGRDIKLGELHLSVFSASLIAQDLSVADDPAFGAAPFVTAKELRIGVSLKPLIFAHEVNLRGFQIESPQINLIRAANGTWNFSSIGHGGTSGTSANGGAPPAGPDTAKRAAQRLPDLSIGLIVVEDGRVTIASQPEHDRPTVYEHVNVTAHDFSFASAFPFELGADLPAGGTIGVTGHLGPIDREDAATSPAEAQISVKGLDPVAAGFLDSDAGVSLLADIDAHAASNGQTVTASGTAHLENLKLRKGATAAPKPLDISYSVVHRLREISGEINDVAVQIGNAAIHVSGIYQPVTPGAVDPLLDLKLSGQSLPIDELQPLMTAAAVRLPNGSILKGGTLSLNLAIKGPAKALVITGAIALDNTRLVGFDIGTKIHGIAALSGVKTGDTTEFQRLRVYVRVTNAGVVAERIEALIPVMGELTGSGTVSADDQLDFNLIAKVASANGVGKFGVGLLTKLLQSSGGSGKESGVPMRVTGTPDDPYITADVSGIVTKRAKSIASIFGGKKK